MSKWKKAMAAAAAVPMLVALLPAGTAVAAEQSSITETTSDTNKVLDLGFDGDLTDSSTAANTVTTYKGTATYADGVDGQAITLNQGALSLGVSQELQPESLSLSFWWNPSATMTGEQILMWGKGKYNENGWYLSSNSDTKPLVLSIGVGSGGSGSGQPLEFNLSGNRADVFPVDTWTHVMVTFDAETKTAKFYINGEAQSSAADNTASTGAIVADDTTKYIGWNGTHASGGTLTGMLDEVKLWNTVATTADVEREVKVGNEDFDAAELAQAALDKVSIAASATSNLTFNTEASNGATLTYASDNPSVISDGGVVTRPAVGEADGTAKITVTASYGSAAVSKTVTVTVPAQTESSGDHDVEYLKNYLSESGMDNVTVADEYLQNAGQKEIEYLLSFDTDRLLVELRTQAGLDTQGKTNYGGWERGYGEGTRFTGHFVGHYISAVSKAQRSTFATDDQKAELATKLAAMVTGIREAQEAYAEKDSANAGFFPAFKVDAVPGGKDGLLVPFYNLHKVEQGMVDAYKYATDDETRDSAKAAAVDFAKWIVNWKSAHSSTNMLSTEYGGMNDALYQVAQIADAGDKAEVLEAAHLFDETSLFQNLANGKDVLSGKHANTTIPKLTGAMQRYVTYTEDEDLYNSLSDEEQANLTNLYLKAAENFWTIVKDDHSYVNGDNSQSEHFHVAGELWEDATQNGDPTAGGGYNNNSTSETCNAHNMLKLTRLLFQVTKDAKYSEYYEHTFINSIVASQNPETGMTTYFQPMKAGYPKVFGTEYGEFWCCQGTGIENFAKLNDSFYFTSGDDVYVNMFRSSTFTDGRHDLTITQTANVPKQEEVTFTVSGTGSANLKLRVPDWTTGATLEVNGEQQDVTAKDDNGWLTVEIADGTEITYSLPAALQAIDTADNANWVAFQYGPVVLAGALTDTDASSNYGYGGVLVRTAAYDAEANAKAAIIPTDGSVSDWLENLDENLVRTDDPDDGEDLAFELRNVEGDTANVKLQPYYTLYESTYAIYWDMADVDSDAYQSMIVTSKETERDESITSDSVTPDQGNNMETTANLQHSDNSSSAAYEGKTYRDAKADGWFSYDLAVDTEASSNYVSVQYNTADVNRSFDIYVDPTPTDGDDMADGILSDNAVKLTTVTVTDDAGSKAFYWESYEVPSDVIAQVQSGKLRIKFVSNGGLVGGVYGVKTLTATEYSDDASLASLDFSVGTLSPEFTGDKTQYTLTVPAETTSVDATIGVKDAGSYVKVDGIVIDDTKDRTITLDDDVTNVDIASYAQDHETVQYYSAQIVRGEAVAPAASDPVLEYTFDDADASADASATVSNTGTAGDSLDGTVTNSGAELVDHDDNGKALKLAGGSHGTSAYVTIPNGVISADQQDLTISADYQWDGASTCVYPWALGKDSKDYLVNIVSCGSNTRVEASKSGTQTQLTGSTPAKNTWVHVDVVVKGGKSISYYLDGELVASKSTELTAADFIGTSTVSGYLGLSFYSSDKDFGGQIDNFKVWNRAVTAAELFNPDEDGGSTPDLSDDATLKSLTVASQTVDLTDAASEDGASLTVDDPDAIADTDVVFETNDSGATVKVSVNVGVVTVTVTAEDGTTTKTYTVTLAKETTTEPEQPDTPDKPEQSAPSETDLTDANHVDNLITVESVQPGAKLTLNVGKAFAGKTVNVYAFSNGEAVLIASGATVSEDGTVVVTMPADLKLGATKFAVQFADDSLVWDAVNVAKPTAEQPKADETANTGAAILGAVALMALLAAAGVALTIWRKRQA